MNAARKGKPDNALTHYDSLLGKPFDAFFPDKGNRIHQYQQQQHNWHNVGHPANKGFSASLKQLHKSQRQKSEMYCMMASPRSYFSKNMRQCIRQCFDALTDLIKNRQCKLADGSYQKSSNQDYSFYSSHNYGKHSENTHARFDSASAGPYNQRRLQRLTRHQIERLAKPAKTVNLHHPNFPNPIIVIQPNQHQTALAENAADSYRLRRGLPGEQHDNLRAKLRI